MNAPERLLLPDIQAADGRALAIDRVGVKALRHPIRVQRPDGTGEPTVATVDMTVGLPPNVKGTHMSRFVVLAAALDTPYRWRASRLRPHAGTAGRGERHVEMRFPYFISKRAPVSGVASLLDYRVMLRGEQTPARGYDFTLTWEPR